MARPTLHGSIHSPGAFGDSRDHWSTTVTVAPAAEPITTADAKTHLRVAHADEDSYIDTLVKTAREKVEADTRSKLITQTLRLDLDRFPNGSFLELPFPPLQSVTSITYTDSDGNANQTFASGNYQVDTAALVGRVRLAADGTASWPTTQANDLQAVQVTYVAGYGASGSDVPASLVHAMQLLVGHWYGIREAVLVGSISKELELTYQALIAQHTIPNIY